jgi:hypothetical protein
VAVLSSGNLRRNPVKNVRRSAISNALRLPKRSIDSITYIDPGHEEWNRSDTFEKLIRKLPEPKNFVYDGLWGIRVSVGGKNLEGLAFCAYRPDTNLVTPVALFPGSVYLPPNDLETIHNNTREIYLSRTGG